MANLCSDTHRVIGHLHGGDSSSDCTEGTDAFGAMVNMGVGLPSELSKDLQTGADLPAMDGSEPILPPDPLQFEPSLIELIEDDLTPQVVSVSLKQVLDKLFIPCAWHSIILCNYKTN